MPAPASAKPLPALPPRSGASVSRRLRRACRSRESVDEAAAAIQSAQATIDRANLDLVYARITAPLSGQISRTQITKGNLIRADNDLLTTIVSLDPIFVYFNVNERDLLEIRERARASIPPAASRAPLPARAGPACDSECRA